MIPTLYMLNEFCCSTCYPKCITAPTPAISATMLRGIFIGIVVYIIAMGRLIYNVLPKRYISYERS